MKKRRYYCPRCREEVRKSDSEKIEKQVKDMLILLGFTDGNNDTANGYYCKRCKVLWDISECLEK